MARASIAPRRSARSSCRRSSCPSAPGDLRLTTKLNGEIVQDARTSNLIWDEAHLVAYLSSRMTLYPGDVIITGTPAGTGMERQKFLKPGDVVTIEIEGIGTLTTPFKALSEKPRDPVGRSLPPSREWPRAFRRSGTGHSLLARGSGGSAPASPAAEHYAHPAERSKGPLRRGAADAAPSGRAERCPPFPRTE